MNIGDVDSDEVHSLIRAKFPCACAVNTQLLIMFVTDHTKNMQILSTRRTPGTSIRLKAFKQMKT